MKVFRPHFESLERRELLAVDLLAGISGGSQRSSTPRDFAAAGQYVYFNAASETNLLELWRTDGTEDGTIRLAPSVSSFRSEPFGDDLIFVSRGQLWRTGGTIETTVRLTDDNISVDTRIPMVVFGDHIYFHGQDRDQERTAEFSRRPGFKLMRSDGTPEGTSYFGVTNEIIRDTLTGIQGIWNDRLHYTYRNRSRDPVLWQTDGTVEGTSAVEGYEGAFELNRT